MQERSSRRATRSGRILAAAFVGGLTLLAPCLAWAQESARVPPVSEWDDSYYPFARTGVFVGLGGLFALENFDTDPLINNADNPLDISADDGGGFELRGGYRATPRLAAEVLFQYYSGFAVKERTSGYDDNFDGWTLTAGGKIYPLLGRLQPYATFGVGGLVFQEKKGDDSGFVARMGAGLDVYLSDQFVVDTEFAYLFPTGSIADFQFATFSLGVQYRW